MLEERFLTSVWLDVISGVRASVQKPFLMVMPVFQGDSSKPGNPAMQLIDDIAAHVSRVGKKDHHVRTLYRRASAQHVFDEAALGFLALSLYSETLCEIAIRKSAKVDEALDVEVVDWALERFRLYFIEALCGEVEYTSEAVVLGAFGRGYKVRPGQRRIQDKVVDYLITQLGYVEQLRGGPKEETPDVEPYSGTHVLELSLLVKPSDEEYC